MSEGDDFLAELEAEIKTITAKTKLRADADKLRKQASNMKVSAAERAAALTEFKTIQSIIELTEWKPIAYAALFTEQSCDGCGSVHYTFLQYMQMEQKIREPSAKRWVRIACPLNGLPRETVVQPLKTHVCSECAEEHGFDVGAPTIRLLPREGELTVSSTYFQGDINAPPQEN